MQHKVSARPSVPAVPFAQKTLVTLCCKRLRTPFASGSLQLEQGVGEDDAEILEAEREANGPYRDVGDLARRATVSRDALEALVRGGACDGFGREVSRHGQDQHDQEARHQQVDQHR